MNINKVLIFGNLTRDPEMRTLPSGQPVINFGVATNRTWKDKSGEKKEQVEFHNVVAFAKQAELISQYLKKGSSIFVEGRLQTRTWEGQDGAKKSRTEIIVENFQFGPKGSGVYQQREDSPAKRDSNNSEHDDVATVEYPDDEVNPEEIPF